jgi:hypothetical protein
VEDNHEHFHEPPENRFERRASCQEDEPTDKPLVTPRTFAIVVALAIVIVVLIAAFEALAAG